jgi:lipocalin
MLSKSKSQIFIIVTIVVLINSIQSSFLDNIFKTKPCPSPQLFTQLEVQPFIGKWYNHKALPNLFEKGKCGSTTYFYDKTNTTLYNQDKELRGEKWVTSPTNTVTHEKPGVLTFHMFFLTAEFNVLDTDYTNYAIVYSCKNLYVTDPYRFAWILTRRPTLTTQEKKAIYAKAEALFKTAEIDITELDEIIQDCKDN